MPVFWERIGISLMTFSPQQPAPITAMLTGTVKIQLLETRSDAVSFAYSTIVDRLYIIRSILTLWNRVHLVRRSARLIGQTSVTVENYAQGSEGIAVLPAAFIW